MYCVLVEVPKDDLAMRMETMRMWLDEHGFVPASFRCQMLPDGHFAVRLGFAEAQHAEAFVAAFAPGQKLSVELLRAIGRKPEARDAAPAMRAEGSILVVAEEPDIRQIVG